MQSGSFSWKQLQYFKYLHNFIASDYIGRAKKRYPILKRFCNTTREMVNIELYGSEKCFKYLKGWHFHNIIYLKRVPFIPSVSSLTVCKWKIPGKRHHFRKKNCYCAILRIFKLNHLKIKFSTQTWEAVEKLLRRKRYSSLDRIEILTKEMVPRRCALAFSGKKSFPPDLDYIIQGTQRLRNKISMIVCKEIYENAHLDPLIQYDSLIRLSLKLTIYKDEEINLEIKCLQELSLDVYPCRDALLLQLNLPVGLQTLSLVFRNHLGGLFQKSLHAKLGK